MTVRRTWIAAVAIIAAIGGGGLAYAETQDQDTQDTDALAGMKITLTQAIAAAEQSAGGHAIAADVTRQGNATEIAVEVALPTGTTTVLVDAQTGKITQTRGGEDVETN